MLETVKIRFILKSPFDQDYVEEFATDLDNSIKVENYISQNFGSNTAETTALVIAFTTAYSDGLIGALGEKSLDFILSKLKIFLQKYSARRKETNLKIEVAEGEHKYQFEAKNITEQNVDNAIIEFRKIVLAKT